VENKLLTFVTLTFWPLRHSGTKGPWDQPTHHIWWS